MTNREWVARQTGSEEARRFYEQERLIVASTEAIAGAMEAAGKNKADLARELGTSRANITQLLSGSRNMTLRSFADLAFACGLRVGVGVEPLRQGKYISQPAHLMRTRKQIVRLEDHSVADTAKRDVVSGGEDSLVA